MQKKKYFPVLMWMFPVVFFAYQFILRLWPGLMIEQVMAQFSINATHFGLLAALYYYGYAGMQIPVAILLDRFSARTILFAFATLCGIATFVFTYTDNWYVACLSRFLIGAGSAVGFLGTSKVISEWFPANQYARMVGFSFSIGLMGAIYGGKPVSILIELYGWQTVAFVLAGASIFIGCSAYAFLRSKPIEKNEATSGSFKAGHFKTLLASPFIWILAFANLLMVGSLEGFADVWGVPYLMTAYGLNKSDAAQLISFIFIGMLFGGPLLALLGRFLKNYTIISLCGVCMAGLFFWLISGPQYHWQLFAGVFFCIGLLCCYQVIVFAAGAELVMPALLGVTVALLNCINMLGGSFFHILIGYAMDAFWSGGLNADSLRVYTAETYETALLIIPGCALLGAAMVAILGIQHRRLSQKRPLK